MNAEQRKPERTERAKELLRTVKHAAMATVNADGSPHNTPYFFMAGPDLQYLYWSSHPDSEHSHNVVRTGQLFVVLYEATQGGGLYIEADRGEMLEDGDLDKGFEAFDGALARHGIPAIDRAIFAAGPQRLWRARAKRFWINAAERDQTGKIVRDQRMEVKREDLL
jgi:hypothetical protein